MLDETELSILEPFLALERLDWGDIVHFHDDVLAMAEAPHALDSFRNLLQHLERRPGKPVVFWSSGRCFCPEQCNALLKALGGVGGPCKEGDRFPGPLSEYTMVREQNVFCALIRWLRFVRRPAIMIFQGDVSLPFLGIGLACDFRIASAETTFYNQGRELDMPPGAGLLYLLPAYVGLGRVCHLVMRSRTISAQSALEWGLLDEVVGPSELDSSLGAMVADVACFSSETLDTIKQLLNQRLPRFDEFVTLETHGLDRALRGKPWERVVDRDGGSGLLPNRGPGKT